VDASLSPEYAPVNGQSQSIPIGQIPQIPKTFAYWDMDYGVQNEKGLSIGESTCTAKTVGWPATPDKPYGYNRAGIEDLSKIALERCATARCAVKLMGSIAVDQGFYSADSGEPEKPGYSDSAEAFAIADSEELWVFNVMTGANNASAIWAAERIPPGNVVAVGNSFTIRKMNLSDSENFLYSPGITKLAEEKGWWSPKNDPPGIFDFFGAYGYTPEGGNPEATKLLKDTLAFYSGRRMWRIFSLLSPEQGAKLDPNKGNLPETADPYPGSVPAPKNSVTPQMVMDVLRDHYEGTAYDLTAGMAAGPFGSPNRGPAPQKGIEGLWERAISMHRTSWSYVLEAKAEGRSISWLGYDSPHGTAYLPFFGAATEGAPDSFHSHDGYMSKFSTKVAWWAFNLVNQYSDLNFQLINTDVRKKAKQIEDEGQRQIARCEATASKEVSKQAAAETLTSCSNSFADEKVAEWWNYAFSLFAKFGRYAITSNETEQGELAQRYPAWWLRSPEVSFTDWSPEGHPPLVPGARPLEPLSPEIPFSKHILAALMAVAAVSIVAVAHQWGVRRGVQQATCVDDYGYRHV
jgi:dipeptidase